jgi:hypothetical protein
VLNSYSATTLILSLSPQRLAENICKQSPATAADHAVLSGLLKSLKTFDILFLLISRVTSSEMDPYRHLLDMFCGDISLFQFLVTVLTVPCFNDHPAVDISQRRHHPHVLAPHEVTHCLARVGKDCAREVRKLAKIDIGWQFSVLHAKAEQIECFRIEEMAMEIEAEAPVLWGLLDAVLSAGRARTTTSVCPRNGRQRNLSIGVKWMILKVS